MGDNPAKAGLIPHMLYGGKWGTCEGLTLWERPMSDQLVGGVKAYQGDDR